MLTSMDLLFHSGSISEGCVEPMYRSSNVAIYQGNVLIVLPQLASASVNAVIADPPYCSGAVNGANRTRQSTRRKYGSSYVSHDLSDFDGDQRGQRSFTYWSTLWLTECRRVTTPGGAVMVFTDWRQIPSIADAIQTARWI